MPYALWPVDVGHRKYQKLYACGYVPHKMLTENIFWNKRCVFPSDWEKIELQRGYDNMPVYWLSLLNDLVNMTLSLKTFGILRVLYNLFWKKGFFINCNCWISGIPNNEISRLKKQRLPLYQAVILYTCSRKLKSIIKSSIITTDMYNFKYRWSVSFHKKKLMQKWKWVWSLPLIIWTKVIAHGCTLSTKLT